MQKYDGTGAAVEPEPPTRPADPEPPQQLIPPRGPRRLAWAIGLFVALVVALALGILLALLAKNVLLGDDSDPSNSPTQGAPPQAPRTMKVPRLGVSEGR